MDGGKDQRAANRSGDRRWGIRSLRTRIWIYAAILLVVLAIRFLPEMRGRFGALGRVERSPHMLTLTGMDTAPVLISRLIESYRLLYPEIDIRVRGGGTRRALEDLFNRDADVAFTCRTMTPDERAIVKTAGDSALSFPIALGGIGVLAARRSPLTMLTVDDLARLIRDGMGAETTNGESAVARIYAPDPNLGLWSALTSQLGLPDASPEWVFWVATDREVLDAVGADPTGIGFASTLAIPADAERMGVRLLPVVRSSLDPGHAPDEGSVASGDYPLYHYVYVSCRPKGGALAAGFVTFLNSGRGQRLVEREGFLPARDVLREVLLVRRPLAQNS